MKNRIGEKYTTNEGYEVEIVEYKGTNNCSIQFNDEFSTLLKNIKYCVIALGNIKNYNHRSVCGKGYIGYGKYKAKENNVNTTASVAWRHMMNRCYNEKTKERQPTYIGCSVCDEWLCFQNFAKWHEENYKKGFHLDKDILFKGNKIYSLETCAFVPVEINSILTKTNSKRGKYPIGVRRKSDSKVEAYVMMGKGKQKILGSFDTPEEAFECYKFHKENRIREVADEWKPLIHPKVYQALINYKVEITD